MAPGLTPTGYLFMVRLSQYKEKHTKGPSKEEKFEMFAKTENGEVMAKLKQKKEQIKDTVELHRRLIELSLKEGGAWTFAITPFSHEVRFFGADSPSKLPDSFLETTRSMGTYPRGRIGYKGKIIGFSEKAYIREQNRGVGGDR